MSYAQKGARLTVSKRVWVQVYLMSDATTLDPRIFRSAFEHCPEPVLVCDPQGRVVLRNKAATELGESIDMLFSAHAERLGVLAHEARDKGQAVAVLNHVEGHNLRQISVRIVPEQENTLVFLRDITNARRLSDELWHLRRVESLGYLTASFAHDLNNVLTTALCTSTLLANALTQHEQLWSLATEMRVAAERATSITREVLSFARRDRAQRERVNLCAVVYNVRSLIARALGEQVELILMLDDAKTEARVDPVQLECVLLNLAANARDAMPNGGRFTIRCGPAIDVSYSPSEKHDHWVLLSVSDTGSGIKPELRERVFEPFFTTKPPGHGAGHGTGLGLATAKQFVLECEGHIAVNDAPGGGTTFTIHLPRAAESHPPDHHGSPEANGNNPPRKSMGGASHCPPPA